MNDLRCPKCSGRLRITISATVKRRKYFLIEVPKLPTEVALECVNCEIAFIGIRKPNKLKLGYAVNAGRLKEHPQDQWLIDQSFKEMESIQH